MTGRSGNGETYERITHNQSTCCQIASRSRGCISASKLIPSSGLRVCATLTEICIQTASLGIWEIIPLRANEASEGVFQMEEKFSKQSCCALDWFDHRLGSAGPFCITATSFSVRIQSAMMPCLLLVQHAAKSWLSVSKRGQDFPPRRRWNMMDRRRSQEIGLRSYGGNVGDLGFSSMSPPPLRESLTADSKFAKLVDSESKQCLTLSTI